MKNSINLIRIQWYKHEMFIHKDYINYLPIIIQIIVTAWD